nr:MAG TPA: hypothetical protein [Herelleviridae sp.]
MRACEICTHYVGVAPTWTSCPHIMGLRIPPTTHPTSLGLPFSQCLFHTCHCTYDFLTLDT